MKLSIGNGGWIRVDDPEQAGPLFVRLSTDDTGRWRVIDLYLAGDRPLTGADMRSLPFSKIEALANDPDVTAEIEKHAALAPVPLRVLASHYGATFGSAAKHWVADAYRSQFPNSGVPAVAEAKPRKVVPIPDVPPLRAPEGSKLTDAFLREVHRAYNAAIDRNEWPALALAAQAGVSKHTVRKWVYTARRRGIMPPGKQGVVS
ncbi:hypothetical protein ACIOD2_25745 [Amycolatopsis sp. NPDC088138]|uniref:hypothetical protein n=1 Tax=Amycolatopsis sp. NPDC088138 TaxID=3363938 RepID=UPI003813C92F